MPKRIESPSSINTFKQCKRKYYHQYIEKLPTLPNIHQVRGNIAHSTLEHFYDINLSSFDEENYIPKLQNTMQKLFLQNWHNYESKLKALNLNPDQKQFYFEETMLMLMNWNNHFLQDLSEVMEKKKVSVQEAFQLLTPIREEEYTSDVYSIRGFIDAVHQLEDEVHIIDYKTNSTFDFKDSIKLQLAIYSLLYFEKHGKMPNKVGIFFLRHKLKLMNVDEQLLELAKREIQMVHEHTSKSEKIEQFPRSMSPLCRWSSGKCDFFDVCNPFEEEKKEELK